MKVFELMSELSEAEDCLSLKLSEVIYDSENTILTTEL